MMIKKRTHVSLKIGWEWVSLVRTVILGLKKPKIFFVHLSTASPILFTCWQHIRPHSKKAPKFKETLFLEATLQFGIVFEKAEKFHISPPLPNCATFINFSLHLKGANFRRVASFSRSVFYRAHCMIPFKISPISLSKKQNRTKCDDM